VCCNETTSTSATGTLYLKYHCDASAEMLHRSLEATENQKGDTLESDLTFFYNKKEFLWDIL